MLSGDILDLRELARMSGLPIRSYFIGADLQNVDLRDQDLRDLSFERADFRGADLRGALFDDNALEGAKLDPFPSTKPLAQLFTGYAITTFDARGRLTLLQPFRSTLIEANQGEFSVHLAMHPSAPCLMGFSTSYLAETPQAVFPSFGAFEVIRFDVSGRFVLPVILRTRAGFDQVAVICGAGEHFEIWAPDQLRRYVEAEGTPRYAELLERVNLGLGKNGRGTARLQ